MPIQNPIINPSEGNYGEVSNAPLTSLIVRLWRTGIILGSLLVLIYSIWGALDWITAQGDKEKIKSARQKIINGLIGLAILVMLFSITAFLQFAFGFDPLNIDWGAISGSSGGETPSGGTDIPGAGGVR